MAEPYALEYALVGANALLYLVLAFQLLRRGSEGLPRVETMSEAFAVLSAELTKAIPNVPRGFTWREAVQEARRMRLDVDWPKVDRAVEAYEKLRYGGIRVDSDFREVLVLARRLRRAR